MADAGIAQINKLSKDDIVIALMGITGSGKVGKEHRWQLTELFC